MNQTLAKRLALDFAAGLSRKLSKEAEDNAKRLELLEGGSNLWQRLTEAAEQGARLISTNGAIELAFRQDSADDFTLYTPIAPGVSIQVRHDAETQEVRWPKFEGFPERAEVLIAHGAEARYHTDSVIVSGEELIVLILRAFVTNP